MEKEHSKNSLLYFHDNELEQNEDNKKELAVAVPVKFYEISSIVVASIFVGGLGGGSFIAAATGGGILIVIHR